MRTFVFCLLTMCCFSTESYGQWRSHWIPLVKVRIAFYNSDYTKAQIYSDTSFVRFSRKKNRNIPFDGRYFYLQARVNYTTNNLQKALEFFNKGLIEFEKNKNNNQRLRAMSYLFMGEINTEIGNYEKAMELCKKGLDIRLKKVHEKHKDISYFYLEQARIYWATGYFEESIDLYNKSIDIKLEMGDTSSRSIAMSYNNLGLVYGDMGDYNTSTEYHNKALKIRLEELDSLASDVAMSYSNLSMDCRLRGEYNQAITYGRKALDIWSKKPKVNQHYIAYTYEELAHSYWLNGNRDKALSLSQEALDLMLNTLKDNHPFLIQCYNSLANYNKHLENITLSTDFYEKALRGWRNSAGEDYYKVEETYANLAKNNILSGEYEKADSLWNMVVPRNLERLKSTYFFLSENKRLKYLETVRWIHSDFYSFVALHGNDTSRQLAAKLLLYSINTNKFIKEIDDEKLTILHEELNTLNKQLADAEIMTNEELEKRGWDLLKIRERQEDLFTEMLKNQKLREKLNPKTKEWQDIQKHLQVDEISLDFIRIYEKPDPVYYAILIRKDLATPQFIRINDEKILLPHLMADADKRPYYIYDDKGGAGEAKRRKELYEKIWQPLEPYLEGIETIHLSPSGALHKVAFDALQGGDETYLADRYDFHYYSAMRDMLKKESITQNYKDIVLMGDIKYDLNRTDSLKNEKREKEIQDIADVNRNTRDGIKRLKYSLEEIKKINDIALKDGLRTTFLTNEQPTEDTIQYFTGNNAPSICHFATHGVFLPRLDTLEQRQKGQQDWYFASPDW